jgi:hypothetical protein
MPAGARGFLHHASGLWPRPIPPDGATRNTKAGGANRQQKSLSLRPRATPSAVDHLGRPLRCAGSVGAQTRAGQIRQAADPVGDCDPRFEAGFVSRLRQVGCAAGGMIDRAVAMLGEELGRAGPQFPLGNHRATSGQARAMRRPLSHCRRYTAWRRRSCQQLRLALLDQTTASVRPNRSRPTRSIVRYGVIAALNDCSAAVERVR